MLSIPFLRTSAARHSTAALGFYALATLALTAPLPGYLLETIPRAVRPDTWLNTWALAWTSEHLVTNPAGLFDANIFFPQLTTLAYSDHFIAQALIAAPAYWLSSNPVLAYNLAWYAALILTAWGGYLWTRALLGEAEGGEAAALVAGAVCLLVPGKLTAFSHLQVISLQGVPFALLFVHRLLERPTPARAAVLAAAVLYAALSSWYTAAYVALLVPVIGGAALLVPAATPDRRKAALLGAAAVSTAAAAMLPVAISYRAVQADLGVARRLDVLVATALRPTDFFASWSWLHSGWMPFGSGAGGHFPGFVAVALMVLGLRAARRRNDPWPFVYTAVAAGFAILSLGPLLTIGAVEIPLPYDLLYRFVPGFNALRNPYRAAFIATILLAVPVAYGAREVIAAGRARLLVKQRWRRTPRVGALSSLTAALAVLLASTHLLEAWPGPQEIVRLPEPSSEVYAWLASDDANVGAALVWPLPDLRDDNARYQLWSIGGWVPLVNGHSGLYPPAFARLHNLDAEFPSSAFLAAVKEWFPATHVVAHYGLVEGGVSRRRLATSSPELREVFAQGDDVVYELPNGAPGGWLRRRIPERLYSRTMRVQIDTAAAGCELVAFLDGVPAGRTAVGGGDPQEVSEILLPASDTPGDPVVLELMLVEPALGPWPRVDLDARRSPSPAAAISVNGTTLAEAPFVAGLLDGRTGRPLGWITRRREERFAAALRARLADAEPGDRLMLAVAENEDPTLIERLHLLLGAAGAGRPFVDRGGAFAFAGTVGEAPGSALEVIDAERAALSVGEGGGCRLGAIVRFEFERSEGS